MTNEISENCGRCARAFARRLLCMPAYVRERLGIREGARVQYVTENADWAIRWLGEGIRNGLPEVNRREMTLTTSPYNLTNQIVHFGSQYMWVDWAECMPRSNVQVVSFLHGKPEDGEAASRHIQRFLELEPVASRIVVSTRSAFDRLLKWGVRGSKIVHIPIGVDLSRFAPLNEADKIEAKKKLGVARGQILLGSFQKDGVGWGNGNVPKLIKGPDIFLDVVESLSEEYDLKVLLTGPARGYVKNGLRKLGVPYVHKYPRSRTCLNELYNALDVYLISSREEGGPMALLESMAAGVPVVATRVGMVPELIDCGETGFIADCDDRQQLIRHLKRVINMKPEKRNTITQTARRRVSLCGWSTIALRYWKEVYEPLLNREGGARYKATEEHGG